MRPAAQLQATIELLDLWDERPQPADRLMAGYFRSRRYIGSKDKASISEQFYTILRNRLSYSYLIEQSDLQPDNRFRAAVWLIYQGHAIEPYFNSEHYSPRSFNPDQLASLNLINVESLERAPDYVKLNIPEWLAPALKAQLGERFEHEMRANQQRATTDIRVNTLKSSTEELKPCFEKLGYSVATGEFLETCLRFDQRVALFGLEQFKQGHFEIQDQGSQLLAFLTQVKAGDRVVDFCAGAGGKTLALAAMMQNRGVIYASDVHSKRLEQLSKRAKRAGAHNIRIHTLSSENDKWVKQQVKKADVVLIDAPCTGTGTWRRSPDSRWNLEPQDLENLCQLQSSILKSASRMVKEGGTLLYATCSVLQQENEDQVQAFLSENPDFSIKEFSLSGSLLSHHAKYEHKNGFFRTYPSLSNTDGFFACQMIRVSGN